MLECMALLVAPCRDGEGAFLWSLPLTSYLHWDGSICQIFKVNGNGQFCLLIYIRVHTCKY